MMAENEERIFRRRFPFGYLLHPNPFAGMDLDVDTTCGQIVFWISLISGLYNSSKSFLQIKPEGLDIYWHPDHHLNVLWTDIVKVEKKAYWGIPKVDVLHIRRPAIPEKRNLLFLTEGMKRRYYELQAKSSLGIPLQAYQGWREIMDELLACIPSKITP